MYSPAGLSSLVGVGARPPFPPDMAGFDGRQNNHVAFTTPEDLDCMNESRNRTISGPNVFSEPVRGDEEKISVPCA